MHLKPITPTPEQRRIFFLEPDQPVLLTGRAGSGKTTTAILRAKQMACFYKLQGITNPKIGVFVFNNTLKDYLIDLVSIELEDEDCEVWVLDQWCKGLLEKLNCLEEEIANEAKCISCLRKTLQDIGLSSRNPDLAQFGDNFLMEELSYILGRFGSDTAKYVVSNRIGRGSNPEIDMNTRQIIAEELVPKYQLLLQMDGYIDWNQLRDRVLTKVSTEKNISKYDILIVDEAQDLSAVQIKIISNLISEKTSCITFIKDKTQRIYKNDYIWNDVEITFGKNCELDLKINYRNTRQIESVATSIIESFSEEERRDLEAVEPELTERNGILPVWYRSTYTGQKAYILDRIRNNIDLDRDSVGVFHFRSRDAKEISSFFKKNGMDSIFLRGNDNFNNEKTSIFTSTLHSAKGLEFDHVFIVGYDTFFAPGNLLHKNTTAHLSSHRKLLYTAVTRARKTLIITSSAEQYSQFLDDIDPKLLSIRG